MKHDKEIILKQYLDGVSKRELMREHLIGTDALNSIIGTKTRKPKKRQVVYPDILYADRDRIMMKFYAALRGPMIKHDEMKTIGIRINKGYSPRVTA